MRKLHTVLIVSTFLLSVVTDVNACGDKTLAVGRGIRMYEMSARHNPSAILIYSPTIAAEKTSPLMQILKRVGHRPTAVGNAAQLSAALKSAQYDLVLTELADVSNVQRQVDAFAPKTVVVPVLYKVSKAEQASAARLYKVIVKNPTTGADYLAAVHQVMKAKTS